MNGLEYAEVGDILCVCSKGMIGYDRVRSIDKASGTLATTPHTFDISTGQALDEEGLVAGLYRPPIGKDRQLVSEQAKDRTGIIHRLEYFNFGVLSDVSLKQMMQIAESGIPG